MMQRELPIADAEAAWAESRNDLYHVVDRLDGDVYLRDLLLLVFDRSGRGRPYEATYERIASTPFGLCCSPRKAYSTVERAVALGVIAKQASDGGRARRANRYAIDWKGVRSILQAGAPRMGAGVSSDPRMDADETLDSDATEDAAADGRTPCEASCTPCEASCTPCEMPRPRARAGTGIKSNTGFQTSSETHVRKTPEPEPVPDPEPEFFRCGNSGGTPAMPAYLASSPVLADAATRTISPKASDRMANGVFVSVESGKLDVTGWIVGWFRAQLAAADPVLGDSEAELLLAIAWGLYAARLPKDEVRKNRAALFAHVVKRRVYRHAARYVDEARRRLDDWLAAMRAQGRGDDVAAIYVDEGVRLET